MYGITFYYYCTFGCTLHAIRMMIQCLTFELFYHFTAKHLRTDKFINVYAGMPVLEKKKKRAWMICVDIPSY